MNKLLLLGLWFTTTITTLGISLLLFSTSPIGLAPQVKGASTDKNVEVRAQYQQFTALPLSQNSTEESVKVANAHVEIVRQFLTKYNSPLLPHAQLLVDVAHKYNLDFRLLPAIAMQESNLCKVIPHESYNCWGFGIYADQVLRFASFDEAIEKVAKGLSSYVYNGLTTPELIMSRYTPSSNGSWATSVRNFMEKME